MSQEQDHNVISLIQRQLKKRAKGEPHPDLVLSPDGFAYASFLKDTQGDAHNEDALFELATARHYIFKMLEHHTDTIRVNHYHVPGERLEEFVLSLKTRPGTLLEIERFYPDTTA